MRLFKKGTLQLTELKTPLEAITPKCLSDRIHYDYQSRSFDIVRSISNKKRDIKRMIYTKVGNTEIVNRGDRKPTCLINLEKGLKKRFFGDHGVVTSEIPSLRKSIRLNFLERTSRLKKKINAGPLTYYFLKSNETQQEIRTDLVKKSYLGRSSYFSIDEDKDLNIRNYLKSVREEEKRNRTETKSPVIHKRRLSRNDVLYESSDKLYDFQIISTNENEAKCNSTTYQKKKRPIIKNHKQMAKFLIKKSERIEKKQGKLDKRLYKIIDKAQVLKPVSVNLKKDFEAITGMKLKKKKKEGQTKELMQQAVRIQGDYTQFGEKKRKMLEISDNIIKMNFKSIKEFGKEIGREYWKKSDGSKKTMPLEMKKRIEQNEKAIRQKINLKHNIVEKLKFNLIHESHVLHHLMEETIK